MAKSTCATCGPVVAELEPGWVPVILKARLWAAVPEAQRVTEDDIRRACRRKADWVAPRMIEQIRTHQCEIAVQAVSRGTGLPAKKWIPCAAEAHDGAARCPRHGGPSRSAKRTEPTKKELAEEVERLRREVDVLRDKSAH